MDTPDINIDGPMPQIDVTQIDGFHETQSVSQDP